jgi:hypothetical protein
MENDRTAYLLSHGQTIVKRGEEIYSQKYKKDYESRYFGKFAAIDINTEKAYISDFSGDAIASALHDSPHGIFHLIRIGFRAAHKLRGHGR